MATRTRQSELPRRLSAALLGALVALAVASATPAHTRRRIQWQRLHAAARRGSRSSCSPTRPTAARNRPSYATSVATTSSAWRRSRSTAASASRSTACRSRCPSCRSRRNLHRVRVDAVPADEGLANTLTWLWDRAYQASRRAFRKIFTAPSREAVTAAAPELKGASDSTGNPRASRTRRSGSRCPGMTSWRASRAIPCRQRGHPAARAGEARGQQQRVRRTPSREQRDDSPRP